MITAIFLDLNLDPPIHRAYYKPTAVTSRLVVVK